MRFLALGLPLLGLLHLTEGAGGPPGFREFLPFNIIYEPSGVQQLPDGRFIVVEDESACALDLFTLDPDGQVSDRFLYRGSMPNRAVPGNILGTLEDLEGVAVDGRGNVFAITSHSRKENGKRHANREQLIRLRVEGNRVADVHRVHNLRKRITKKHAFLKAAAKERKVKEEGGFNIEGLSFDADKQRLLVGFRSPLVKKDAIIVTIENPHAIFEQDEKPRISDDLTRLDLKGGGIRALSYDPYLGGYLIVSRRPGKAFKLWFWDGVRGSKPRRIRVANIKDLRQAEGITPVRLHDNPQGILIVSDDGDEERGRPGHYVFVSYEQIAIGKKRTGKGE
jgi:hypothetical protein